MVCALVVGVFDFITLVIWHALKSIVLTDRRD